MTTLQEAARKALDVMTRQLEIVGPTASGTRESIEALRTALAQQGEQQPVAWMDESGWCTQSAGLAVLHEKHCGKLTPLYANAPPPR